MRFKAIIVACVAWASILPACMAAPTQESWPAWSRFSQRFVQADGRVIDLTFDRKSTSEGQSYALFFALVANQRAQFDTLLKWTSDNLAGGQLGRRLPAWLWGLRDDGSWGVKDQSAASDADLWIAYTLLEAARLWNAPGYALMARELLLEIRRQEVAVAGRAGPVLLPGPNGFSLDGARFRLDPSYLPGFMFQYLAVVDPRGPWQAIWDGYLRMAPAVFAAGVAPDLFVVDSNGVISPDSERTPSGSYDAIRVYLWAGMSGASSAALLPRLDGFTRLVRELGRPPEKLDPTNAVAVRSDYAPIGFSGAVLPFLQAIGEKSLLQSQLELLAVAARRAHSGEATNYYDQVLILFGQGWLDGYYRFDEQGRLQPRWRR